MTSDRQRCVLIVEDEALLRCFAREVLEDAGFVATEAATADEARGLLAQGLAVDLLLTDIEMPGEINGLDLAWEARTLLPGVAVVVASGRQLPKPHELPPRARFVAKPYHPDLLLQMVTEVLG